MSDVSYRVADYRNEIMRELACTMQYKPASKDILIVVHSQLPYLKKCIFSIRKHTQNYKILVWDNGSDEETSFWEDLKVIWKCPKGLFVRALFSRIINFNKS